MYNYNYYYYYYCFHSTAAGFIVMFNYSIVWMKMISYTQVNSWCGCGQGGVATPTNNNHDKPLVQYPDNITVKGKPL